VSFESHFKCFCWLIGLENVGFWFEIVWIGNLKVMLNRPEISPRSRMISTRASAWPPSRSQNLDEIIEDLDEIADGWTSRTSNLDEIIN
jgi:hypothetical protein